VARHLNSRDYMISHPNEAATYRHLKEALAQKHPEDIERDMNGKDGFIKEIDRKAKHWKENS